MRLLGNRMRRMTVTKLDDEVSREILKRLQEALLNVTMNQLGDCVNATDVEHLTAAIKNIVDASRG